ncbi:MAG: glycerophosphodiester phosphodiesterase [Frankiales bacterium]|nr:glycerophosphodiester phosphodiesterase [Frankiales bacterium]
MRYAFAHRGGRGHGPDNTLDTFRQALAGGATGLETDAWLTADGVVVLDHDGVLRAARRQHRPIAEVRRAELPAHVPSLDELYTECGTAYDLAIDIRLPEVAAAVVGVARQHDAADRLWLVGGTAELLSGWREDAGGAQLAMTIKPTARSRELPSAVRDAGGAALNMRWMWWTRGFAAAVHDAGLLAFGYDAQSRFALRRCVRLGLDGVFSDHTDRMMAAMETTKPG